MNQRLYGSLGLVIVLVSACSKQEVPQPIPTTPASLPLLDPTPSLDALNRGARLFQQHCAQCHGPEGQGHPDWQTPGVVAAPPLNGTGNDWKRTHAELTRVIKNGVVRDSVPAMPGWKDRLSDTEVADIIAWFQALWPADVYAQWRRSNPTPRG